MGRIARSTTPPSISLCPPGGSEMPSVFEEAYNSVENVDQIVSSRINDASATSQALQSTALSTIAALQGVNFNFSAASPPSPPHIDPNIDVSINLTPVTPTTSRPITPPQPTPPAPAT